ncbi:GH25 family lysozyme [Bifidobacterium sp. ESL0690]|uniref:GH25 family lysozyme n=1 Tax=Bifidobacterium sp. ESL0690 TaxID=2983214 RepID=UPI0023F8DB13|nr:GH25 family lysozyme [Bifidobacterium sp. ESL0690]WEV46584.1 GH25 family lysozyme [Bifidobacterium sp. ESL0690]
MMKTRFTQLATKLGVVIAIPALGLALTAVPAQAASDTNLSGLGQAGIGSTTSSPALGTQRNSFGSNTIGNQRVSPAADDAKDTMPDNPSQKLPDKVSAAVPDDATVVSKDLAVTKDGQVKNVETGKPVTDPKLVGTPTKQPDPLAKTGGKHFIPVEAGEVKQAVQKNGGDANAGSNGSSGNNSSANNGVNGSASSPSSSSSAPSPSPNAPSGSDSSSSNPSNTPAGNEPSAKSSTGNNASSPSGNSSSSPSSQSANGAAYVQKSNVASGNVHNVALQNNQYGAYWGWYNGTQAFFEYGGNLFAQQAKGVVDVSEHQGTIDWQRAKNAGVEGAIIRIGFGWGNRLDYQAQRNVNECKRLGIPFGVYLYSYAYDNNSGAAEGSDTVQKLRQLGVSPGDLSYPVFYDLENWTWTGHAPPTSPSVYDGVVNNWFMQVQLSGYGNVSVYSYTSYLYGPLNSGNIHSRTRWVASYGSRVGFNFPTNDRGWQYADNNWIDGIGTVDANAFGNYQSDLNIIWIMRNDYIDIGTSAGLNGSPVDYKWQSYDLGSRTWRDITGWVGGNWASWYANSGDYWLQLEVRDRATQRSIGTKTIAFHYTAGNTYITGTYSGWSNGGILLGMSSSNPWSHYQMKIYDYGAGRWVQQFGGQWAMWHPRRGVYWTHYELYTWDGRLADTKTYAFGV